MKEVVLARADGAYMFNGQDLKHEESLEHRLCSHYITSVDIEVGPVGHPVSLTASVLQRPGVCGLLVYWTLPLFYVIMKLKGLKGQQSDWFLHCKKAWASFLDNHLPGGHIIGSKHGKPVSVQGKLSSGMLQQPSFGNIRHE